MARQAEAGRPGFKPGEKLSRVRQRQKLIDACISALHQHGPSRTTIDKVVAIADMSPGIVNFYFETKAALLVAALDFLAVEFEKNVLLPLATLRETPVAALRRLVELYLDPDIASPRKVSVWYAFWGEASARHEYYEICGRRDLDFAELVRDLMARLIEDSGAVHLDADAVALGLIGSLEMIWQGIAFQDESDIDRAVARQRCIAYLASVFPQYFAVEAATEHAAAPHANAAGRPAKRVAPGAGPAPQATALLLAGELSLAGIAAIPMPLHWPGYHILAQQEAGPPQRIFVVSVTDLHDVALTDPATAHAADWLAIMIHPSGGRHGRRFALVPASATATGPIDDLFVKYEANFRLEPR